MKAGPSLWLAVLAFSTAPQVSAAQPAGPPVLQSVRATVEGSTTIVTVNADGPLPEPSSGTADSPPPRVFLDFAGVIPLPGEAGKQIRLPGQGLVTGVRVALFSATPSVTRVVLDLKRLERFTVNTDDRLSGRIRIVIGSPAPVTAATPAAPVPAATPAPATATATPTAVAPVAEPPAPSPPAPAAPPTVPAGVASAIEARPETAVPPYVYSPPNPTRRGAPQPELSGAKPSASAVERYRRQLSGTVERLDARRVVITAIDLDEPVAVATLEATLAELKSVQGILATVKPSDELQPTHDWLTATCMLGERAAALRLEAERGNNPDGRRNAASAAAGALMLLGRACAVLGCGPKR